MPRRTRAQREALARLHVLNAAHREARRTPYPVLVRLLNPNQWRHIQDAIIKYLNKTEFANLPRPSNRRLRATLLSQPPRKSVCQALKASPVDDQNDEIDGQRSTCWITSQNFPPPSLRPCEGPQAWATYHPLDLPPMHNSTFEIYADCSNNALFHLPPLFHIKISRPYRPCSLADADAQRFPMSWTCRCFSHPHLAM